jgi:PBSX family phage terminase large subunit
MAKAKIKADDKIKALAAAADAAGLPRDQVERFIKAGYIPLEGMLPFHAAARAADRHDGPQWIALGGKRGPGKSHTIMSQVLDDCLRAPGIKVLFLRRIKRSAAESMEDVIRRVFKYTPYNMTGNGLELENGSRVVIGGYKDAADIDKYLGIEYDIIIIEECTQITEDKLDKLRGSLRSSRASWRPRMYLSTNADGVGLAWFKRRFVEPARKGREFDTRFFDVTGIRNPFINPEYEQWLDSLTGALRAAWRDGDWDAFAGMSFPMWNYEQHVIKSFDIPHDWPRWRAIDEGFAAPFCCLWFARDPYTRRIYVYRELYQAELTLEQQAQRILDMTQPNERIMFTYADPAMQQRKNRKGQVYSAFDEYRDNGIILTPADNDRISGKRKIDQLLSIQQDGEPGLQIFDHCRHVIEQLGNLARDKINPEDVDTTAEDHAYDALRYGQTNERRTQAAPKQHEEFRHPLAGVPGL